MKRMHIRLLGIVSATLIAGTLHSQSAAFAAPSGKSSGTAKNGSLNAKAPSPYDREFRSSEFFDPARRERDLKYQDLDVYETLPELDPLKPLIWKGNPESQKTLSRQLRSRPFDASALEVVMLIRDKVSLSEFAKTSISAHLWEPGVTDLHSAMAHMVKASPGKTLLIIAHHFDGKISSEPDSDFISKDRWVRLEQINQMAQENGTNILVLGCNVGAQSGGTGPVRPINTLKAIRRLSRAVNAKTLYDFVAANATADNPIAVDPDFIPPAGSPLNAEVYGGKSSLAVLQEMHDKANPPITTFGFFYEETTVEQHREQRGKESPHTIITMLKGLFCLFGAIGFIAHAVSIIAYEHSDYDGKWKIFFWGGLPVSLVMLPCIKDCASSDAALTVCAVCGAAYSLLLSFDKLLHRAAVRERNRQNERHGMRRL